MPENSLQEIKKRKVGEKPDLQPKISNSLGISGFVQQFDKIPVPAEKTNKKRTFEQTSFKGLIDELS